MIDLAELEAQSAVLVRNGCGGSCVTTSDDVLQIITRLRQAEKDAARYIFLRDEATDYHTGEIHGANEEDKDDLVDMFMEQLNDKVKQFERARSKMIRNPIDEAMQCK